MKIRFENPGDHEAIHAVNVAAFPTDAEARLVDELRKRADPTVSLVAEEDGEIVGHIFFSPVRLDDHPGCRVMGLAPMAVLPGHQRKGIGSALVKAGLEECAGLGCGAVIVLGHPEYYPRFGFKPASHFGIRSEYEVPDEAFMALELQPGYLAKVPGLARYHEAFAEL